MENLNINFSQEIACLRDAIAVINLWSTDADNILTQTLGEHFSWVESSTELQLPYRLSSESKLANDLLAEMWRLRLDLNRVRIDADECEIDGFLKESSQLLTVLKALEKQVKDRDSTIKKQQKEIDELKSNFVELQNEFMLSLKAIAINLEATKGERKPDEIRNVDGVMTRYRVYGDSPTHAQRNECIDHISRVVDGQMKRIKSQTTARSFLPYDDDF